jgi:hypothetical protein
MIPTKIRGANVTLSAPNDWNDTDATCAELPVLMQETASVGMTFQSAWRPTPEELKSLAKGYAVILTVCGRQHPPVSITVSDRRLEA